MKVVFSFHPETKQYTGPIGLNDGDLSPLEPGVYLIPAGCTEISPPVPGVGQIAKWDGGSWVLFTPQEPIVDEPTPEPETNPVPSFVSRFQARAALYQAGYLDQIQTLMVAAETPMLMKLAWADAQEFRRDSVTVATMAAALALTSEQVDNLFIAAAQITA